MFSAEGYRSYKMVYLCSLVNTVVIDQLGNSSHVFCFASHTIITWASRLKSPPTQLFVQPVDMANIEK